MLRGLFICLIWLLSCASLAAQELRALARVDMAGSTLSDSGTTTELNLALTQAVPYRVLILDAPKRIVLDFREVAFEAGIANLDTSERIASVRAGLLKPGWSRLVLELSEPMGVASAALRTDPVEGDAMVRLRLEVIDEIAFAAHVSPAEDDLITLPQPPTDSEARPRQTGERPVVVMLDPGHGGIDPGAQVDGYDEADLMLLFARELRETLMRRGGFDVLLTREADMFVSLPARVSLARAARADVFISLHADALEEGRATGATIYTLSGEASDSASAKLAERQDRTDIVAGVDLSRQDDEIATVLMDLARLETEPRSDLLADYLVGSLREQLGTLYKKPRMRAGFSVLKAPDIPSVLIELGFMSSKSDLDNLKDPDWRARAIDGIAQALGEWAVEDAAQAARLRQ
jgi:N-acetylmuramoyl-L-alanine amidase